MPQPRSPHHVVVDGSNIATEGRSAPSLKQLNEAVLAFMDEHPTSKITVVVDASFGHRIDKKEVADFDDAVNNNELVTPPAGAIGRGDAFVLAIADKVKASIISNDSYQEFHGEHTWLFDEGRLMGGKPVPHVGWVFVNRSPVRGATSKKATRGVQAQKRTREDAPPVKKASREASGPMPTPKTPPPGARMAPRTPEKVVPEKRDSGSVNEVLPFLAFVEKQPVGSKVKGVVDSYSAHGAYVKVGDIKGYVPLRFLGNPAPRSARDAIQIGDTLALVVAGYTPARRSVELGVPEAVKIAAKETKAKASAKAEKKPPVRAAKKAAPVVKKAAVPKKAAAVVKKAAAAVKKVATPTKKSVAKKAAAPEKAVSKAAKK